METTIHVGLHAMQYVHYPSTGRNHLQVTTAIQPRIYTIWGVYFTHQLRQPHPAIGQTWITEMLDVTMDTVGLGPLLHRRRKVTIVQVS